MTDRELVQGRSWGALCLMACACLGCSGSSHTDSGLEGAAAGGPPATGAQNAGGSGSSGAPSPGTTGTSAGSNAPSAGARAGAGRGGSAAAAGAGGSMSGTGMTAGANGAGQAGAGGTGTQATGGRGAATGGAGAPGPAPARVDNPYADAKGYVNPEWQAKAQAEMGGAAIANTSTAVWLDRIAAIEGTANSGSNGPMGLRDHLEAALGQHAGYIQFVIYDLPGRDCAALASNGELGTGELPRYKSEYIDPIAAIMGDVKYRALRIINIIEPDSLPNLVTNASMSKCSEMKSNGGYVQGVAYALQKLGALPNTYNYIDAGHHGWLGWDTNLGPSAELFSQAAGMAGKQNVHGFITNTANYSALSEPFLQTNAMVNGMSLKQSKWLDWNPFADETSFAKALRDKLISLGFDAGLGMLIDTSRNGWGGASRPSMASTATDLDAFVNASRIDRRIQAGNWCNQSGAGLGERPRANPAAGIDAYVWIKPPGESDGSSSEIANTEGKGFDRMCDPTYGGNSLNGNNPTGALANAPLAGAWFSAQFQELVRNAYPPL